MTVPYHFIVAGLPDILFDEALANLSLETFIHEISEIIPVKDGFWLKYIGYPIDNKNLMKILRDEEEPIYRVGNFSEELLKNELKNPDSLPDYLQEFLAIYLDNGTIVQGLSWENQLNWLFYDHATSLDNRFLAEWFTFELNLRNILAAIKCRRTGNPFEPHIICRNEVTDLLFKSSAIDFALSSKISWADDLFTVDFYDITKSEEYLDRLRLQQLEDIAEPGLFTIDTILRVGIGLSIIERWNLLNDKTGKEMLDKLINDLEAGYQAE